MITTMLVNLDQFFFKHFAKYSKSPQVLVEVCAVPATGTDTAMPTLYQAVSIDDKLFIPLKLFIPTFLLILYIHLGNVLECSWSFYLR